MHPNDVYKNKPTSVPDSTWDEIIQQSVATNTHLTTGTQGLIRNTLTHIGETLNPNFEGKRRYHTYARSKLTEPYTASEQQRIWQWALIESRTISEYAMMKQVIVACGLGGGLKFGDATNLRVHDVLIDARGVCLRVGERIVPIVADWDQGLRRRLETNPNPDEYLLYPRSNNRSVIMNRFKTAESNAAFLVPSFEKMRVTWIAEHMRHFVPDTAIANAAGVKSLRNYERFRPAEQSLEQYRGLMHRAGTRPTGLVVAK